MVNSDSYERNSFDINPSDNILLRTPSADVEGFQIPDDQMYNTQPQEKDKESRAFLNYTKSLIEQAKLNHVYLFDIIRQTDKVLTL